jgi:hypothetical protein
MCVKEGFDFYAFGDAFLIQFPKILPNGTVPSGLGNIVLLSLNFI